MLIEDQLAASAVVRLFHRQPAGSLVGAARTAAACVGPLVAQAKDFDAASRRRTPARQCALRRMLTPAILANQVRLARVWLSDGFGCGLPKFPTGQPHPHQHWRPPAPQADRLSTLLPCGGDSELWVRVSKACRPGACGPPVVS